MTTSTEPLRLYPMADPLPEEVQTLRESLLPVYGSSADDLILDAVNAVLKQERERARIAAHTYSCSHCRDGKDLPQGYICNRCGADNPGNYS